MVTRLPETPALQIPKYWLSIQTDRLPVSGGVIYTPLSPNPAGMKHILRIIILCY